MADPCITLDSDDEPDVMTEEEWQSRMTARRSLSYQQQQDSIETISSGNSNSNLPHSSFYSESTRSVVNNNNQLSVDTNFISSSSLHSSGHFGGVSGYELFSEDQQILERVASERSTATTIAASSLANRNLLPINSVNDQQIGPINLVQQSSTVVIAKPNLSSTNLLAPTIYQSHQYLHQQPVHLLNRAPGNVRHIPPPPQIFEPQPNNNFQNYANSNGVEQFPPEEPQNDDDEDDEVQFICEAPNHRFYPSVPPPPSVSPDTYAMLMEDIDDEDRFDNSSEMTTENEELTNLQQQQILEDNVIVGSIPAAEQIWQPEKDDAHVNEVMTAHLELMLPSPSVSIDSVNNQHIFDSNSKNLNNKEFLIEKCSKRSPIKENFKPNIPTTPIKPRIDRLFLEDTENSSESDDDVDYQTSDEESDETVGEPDDNYQPTDDSDSGESDNSEDELSDASERRSSLSGSHSSRSSRRGSSVEAKLIPCPACNNNWPLTPRLQSNGEVSIYCDQVCLKKHVNLVIRYMKNMRQKWKQRHSNVVDDGKQLKFRVINRENDQLESKQVKENSLLKFISKNQTYSIFKPERLDYFDEFVMIHKSKKKKKLLNRSKHFNSSTHKLSNNKKTTTFFKHKMSTTSDKSSRSPIRGSTEKPNKNNTKVIKNMKNDVSKRAAKINGTTVGKENNKVFKRMSQDSYSSDSAPKKAKPIFNRSKYKLENKKPNDDRKIYKPTKHLSDTPKRKYKRVSMEDDSSCSENDAPSSHLSHRNSADTQKNKLKMKKQALSTFEKKSCLPNDSVNSMRKEKKNKNDDLSAVSLHKAVEMTQKEPGRWKIPKIKRTTSCDEPQVDSGLTSAPEGGESSKIVSTSSITTPTISKLKPRIQFNFSKSNSTSFPLDILLPKEDNKNYTAVQNELNHKLAINSKSIECMPSASLLGISPGLSIWKGKIDFSIEGQKANFFANANLISGNYDEEFFKDSRIEDNNCQLTISTRIKPDEVLQYLAQLKSNSSQSDFSVVQFVPCTLNHCAGYQLVYDYLLKAERYGFVETSKKFVRNFYVVPLPGEAKIPEELDLSTVDFFNKNRPNLLLGILIYNRRCTVNQHSLVQNYPLERSLNVEGDHTLNGNCLKLPQIVTHQQILPQQQNEHFFQNSRDSRLIRPFTPTWLAMQNNRNYQCTSGYASASTLPIHNTSSTLNLIQPKSEQQELVANINTLISNIFESNPNSPPPPTVTLSTNASTLFVSNIAQSSPST